MVRRTTHHSTTHQYNIVAPSLQTAKMLPDFKTRNAQLNFYGSLVRVVPDGLEHGQLPVDVCEELLFVVGPLAGQTAAAGQ